MPIPNATDYLKKYFIEKSVYYSDLLRDYKPRPGHPSYTNEGEIYNCLGNMHGNVSEQFKELRVPEDFPTEKDLIDAVTNFITLLSKDEIHFKKCLASYNDKFQIPNEAVLINKEYCDLLKVLNEFKRQAGKELQKAEKKEPYENDNYGSYKVFFS